MVTMTDVAAEAGVPVSNVSHVVNGTRAVSDALTAQVHWPSPPPLLAERADSTDKPPLRTRC